MEIGGCSSREPEVTHAHTHTLLSVLVAVINSKKIRTTAYMEQDVAN